MKTNRQSGKDRSRIGLTRRHALRVLLAGGVALSPSLLRAGVVGLPEANDSSDENQPALVADVSSRDKIAVSLADSNAHVGGERLSIIPGGVTLASVAARPDVGTMSAAEASPAARARVQAVATIPVHPAAWTGSMMLAVVGVFCSYRRCRLLLL